MCVCAFVIISVSYVNVLAGSADASVADKAMMETFISNIYKSINFDKDHTPGYEVFATAYRGYMNLLNSGKLGARQVITLCDLDLPSTEKRMWVIDLLEKKVLFNTYVAHGQGSGDEYATVFSNRANTHASSMGFYVTGDTYEGDHGTSLHLNGMDEGYNDAAYDRGIVVHGADYVSSRYIALKNKLGRSWGCPAVPAELSLPIISAIEGGTCLFIYHNDLDYLRASYWLNKKAGLLPQQDICDAATAELPRPKMKQIQYITNGKVDSVKYIRVD
jgi:hypothetical protein